MNCYNNNIDHIKTAPYFFPPIIRYKIRDITSCVSLSEVLVLFRLSRIRATSRENREEEGQRGMAGGFG